MSFLKSIHLKSFKQVSSRETLVLCISNTSRQLYGIFFYIGLKLLPSAINISLFLTNIRDFQTKENSPKCNV